MNKRRAKVIETGEVLDIKYFIFNIKVDLSTEQNGRFWDVVDKYRVNTSLSVEGNTLSIDQITAIIENRRVLGPINENRVSSSNIEYNNTYSKVRLSDGKLYQRDDVAIGPDEIRDITLKNILQWD